MALKTDEELRGSWMLLQDGKPIKRGLGRYEAEQAAARRAKMYEGHVSGSSNRVPAFEIARDTQAMKELNENYRFLKEETIKCQVQVP